MGLMDFLRREFSFITGNYRILVVSWMMMDLASEMPAPNNQYYVVQVLHGDPFALGLIGLASFLAMAAVAFPGGFLADKFGRRWLITTMTFVMALSNLLFAFAPNWTFLLMGSIIMGLSLIYQPALFSMVQDSLPPEKRGMGSSIIQLIHSTFNTPGPVIAGFLLLQLGLEWSMRTIYIIITILYLCAAIWRLRLKETMINREPIRLKYFISSYPQAIKESFRVWKVVPRSMFWLLVSQILTMTAMSFFNVVNALYAREVRGIPETLWWLVYVPLLATMIIASIPIGKIVDKYGRKKPLIGGLITFASAITIFIYGDLFTIMFAMVLFGVGILLFMAALMALATDLVPAENRGKVNGFTNFMGYIFMGLGMLLGGYFYSSFGFPALPFVCAIALTIPTAIIVLFLVHEPEKPTTT